MATGYGLYGGVGKSPRLFMIQALTKCILNNDTMIRAIEEKNHEELKGRVYNSLKLLELMHKYLNTDDENETVSKVAALFEWYQREIEEVSMHWEGKEEIFTEKIKQLTDNMVEIRDGFKGMKDE